MERGNTDYATNSLPYPGQSYGRGTKGLRWRDGGNRSGHGVDSKDVMHAEAPPHSWRCVANMQMSGWWWSRWGGMSANGGTHRPHLRRWIAASQGKSGICLCTLLWPSRHRNEAHQSLVPGLVVTLLPSDCIWLPSCSTPGQIHLIWDRIWLTEQGCPHSVSDLVAFKLFFTNFTS